MPSFGGSENPRRTSRSRRPSTAVSTVSTSASYPASRQRSIISLTSPRSRHTYTWNQRRPLLTAATSSIDRVDIVDSVYGSPARSAARATASSPSGSAMRVNPVGASTSGNGSGLPSSVVDGSTSPTDAQHARPELDAGEGVAVVAQRAARPRRRRRCSRTRRRAAAAWRSAGGRRPTPPWPAGASPASSSIRRKLHHRPERVDDLHGDGAKKRRSAEAMRARASTLDSTTSTIVSDVCVWPRAVNPSTGTPAAASAVGVGDALVAQRVELARDDERRRQARQVVGAQRRRLGIGPVGGIGVVVPEPLHQRRRQDVAVGVLDVRLPRHVGVGDRRQQQLADDLRPAGVARQPGDDGGEVAAGAPPGDGELARGCRRARRRARRSSRRRRTRRRRRPGSASSGAWR